MILEQLKSQMTKITWTDTSHIIIKMDSKWIGNLNDNNKAIKVLEKNREI